jgi:group II intron reverse transcriptase/maturase
VDQYEEHLQANLRDLSARLHRGAYHPQPSLRCDIPKGNGKTRPLGIARVEDKIVQRAVVMILERMYEVDLYELSSGFRPGRSCHQALSVRGKIISTRKVNWILDADIRGFFDNACHERKVELLRHRIADPQMLALIGRFLKADVMIDGRREDTDEKVPQGSVLSHLLANVYLHYVLAQWFGREVKPRLRGEAYMIRYADDFICAKRALTHAFPWFSENPEKQNPLKSNSRATAARRNEILGQARFCSAGLLEPGIRLWLLESTASRSPLSAYLACQPVSFGPAQSNPS